MKGEISCLSTIYPKDDNLKEHPLEEFKEISDTDTMYLHEAMVEPDQKEFITSVVKEVIDQMGDGNYLIIPKNWVPTGENIIPALWQMKHK